MAEAAERMHNAEAEQSALGGMMLDHRVIADVFEVTSPGDFYEPRHEIIAQAIRRLAGHGQPSDVISVSDELERTGELRRAGGAEYLHQLTSYVPTAANAGYYAGIVREFSMRRRLREAGLRVAQSALALNADAVDVIEAARAEIDKALGTAVVTARPIGDSLADLIGTLADPPSYVPTAWDSINAIVGGLRPGNMIVVGARPGSGKTVFGLSSATELARHGNVAFCSMEMSEAELQKRLLAQVGSIRISDLVNHAVDPSDWDRIRDAQEKIENLNIYVNDGTDVTVSSIRSFVRSVSRKGPLAGVVVDYAQLMRAADPRQPRQEAVAEFSRSLKLLAKEFAVPVIVLSQLNRASEQRADKKPSMADLRESGAIEQDADVIFLLDRAEDDGPNAGMVRVQVAKNRHGRTDETALAFLGHYARMDEPGGGFNPYAHIEGEAA